MISQKPLLQVGTLTIASSDGAFAAGFEVGYRQYKDLYQGTILTDHDLLSILLDNLAGIASTCTYKIGLISGWYAALYAYDQQPKAEVLVIREAAR